MGGQGKKEKGIMITQENYRKIEANGGRKAYLKNI